MATIDYRAHPVLVVDDEPDILASFRLGFGREFQILCADSGASALEVLERTEVSVIVADQRMPGMSGLELLARSMVKWPRLVRIVLTGYTDVGVLVEAINSSRIYRYVTKPWEPTELGLALRRAIEVFHLERENERLLEALKRANERLADENEYLRVRDARDATAEDVVGSSAAMREVWRFVDRVAPTPTTVLLSGETGTGKERIARAVHDRSPRRERLFVAVNCAALAENLLESELFGHRRGAFTGAAADRKGLFETAHGGTLFLDEIGETTAAMQAKLLRVLQEGEVVPVGDTKPRKVDVRLIAATNRSLEEEVRAGRFREDLYYRLRVFPIRIPPLRDRREDVPELVRHFVARHAPRLGRSQVAVSDAAIAALLAHSFPGNVRELENEIERAVLLCDPGEEIGPEHLSDEVQRSAAEVRGGPARGSDGSLRDRVDAHERSEIDAALARAGGNKTHAARALGLTYRGLLKKMQRLGMVD